MTLLERLNERWERMDGAAATKIDRILKERREAVAEIERLEAECFKLAAGVCEHRSGDDHGNPYCLKSKTNI